MISSTVVGDSNRLILNNREWDVRVLKTKYSEEEGRRKKIRKEEWRRIGKV